MKWKMLIVTLALVFVFVPSVARADSPQPFQSVITRCSGLGSVAQVQQAEQVFDTQSGYDHQLTTPAQWQGSFISRVNEFASTVGCPPVLQDDGSLSGALTFSYRIYVPWYTRYSRNLPQ